MSIDLGRAEFAYNKVEDQYKKLDEKSFKKFKSYTKKIPSLIQTNGLANTLAYMKDKKEEYEIIYDIVNKWVRDNSTLIDIQGKELISYAVGASPYDYNFLTEEIIKILLWMKRFVSAY